MLENIKSPSDIKKLSYHELTSLAAEIRKTVIETVSKNGGHLASNLGMVEASIALHRVFDSPSDKIIFDVGHQCYAHKLLTGRYGDFETLRCFGGISGFPRRSESPHDILNVGHSGMSISAALGIATANKLNGNGCYTVAVVGDGSLTNGMIYEALNNCADKELDLVIVLNDNEMSISHNVGGLHKYLTRLRTSSGYFTFKRKFEKYLSGIPVIGGQIAKALKLIKDALKRMFVKDTLFEDLGLIYVGPVDGHDIEKLCRVFEEAKQKHRCCVVHMRTKKGYGYQPAEEKPDRYHGVGHFDAVYGIEPDATTESFSSAMGDALCDIAKNEPRLCAITAAMRDGTGLSRFAEEFPTRFFDVGIAEEHAITFASGLSVSGMKPVVALYSTFSQRVYDQIIHDVSLQDLPLTLVLDRCGIVSGDGITHQGIFDYSLFSAIPNTSIYSPATYDELRALLEASLERERGIDIIRYPKGAELTSLLPMQSCGEADILYTPNIHSADAVIITYGRLTEVALNAAELLSDRYGVAVIRLLKIFPLSASEIEKLISPCRAVYILDEGYVEGGVGQKLVAALRTDARISVKAIEGFLEHGNTDELMKYCGFTADQTAAELSELLGHDR